MFDREGIYDDEAGHSGDLGHGCRSPVSLAQFMGPVAAAGGCSLRHHASTRRLEQPIDFRCADFDRFAGTRDVLHLVVARARAGEPDGPADSTDHRALLCSLFWQAIRFNAEGIPFQVLWIIVPAVAMFVLVIALVAGTGVRHPAH
jgi:hypothetical protein